MKASQIEIIDLRHSLEELRYEYYGLNYVYITVISEFLISD